MLHFFIVKYTFLNSKDFVDKISAGGLAVMELIARDMKSMGVYLSRNISYDDVQYERLEHKLTTDQKEIYDTLAKSWQIVFQNMQKALETTQQVNEGRKKGDIYGKFWGDQQRFFNQILTAMQMPTVLKDMEKQLTDGKSIVVQLVNTNEAAQNKELSRIKSEGASLEEFDITPKQTIMSFVENAFPVDQYETYEDDEGKKHSRPVLDSEGKSVLNREAVAMREQLLDRLGSIKVPSSALDMIINHFGVDMVAENTGRSRRVVNINGKMVEQSLGSKKDADVDAFQNGNKRIMIFSKAGGTGKSYHADLNAKNQQQRVHYLLQAGWQADAAVQGFGRSHRSNQAIAPIFKLVTTDLKGQMRFISTIAKRLDQLGALTKGQRQTGSQGMFNSDDNLEGPLASDILAGFYKDLFYERIEGIDGQAILKNMGLFDKFTDEYGRFKDTSDELRAVNKFLNRILVLESDVQNSVFDEYFDRLHTANEILIQSGKADVGLENYKAEKVEIKEAKDIRTDELTGAKTTYYNLLSYHKPEITKFNDIDTDSDRFEGYMKHDKSGEIRAIFRTKTATNADGSISQNYKIISPTKSSYISQSQFYHYEKITEDEAKKYWDNEVKNIPEFETKKLNLISGVILPVWDKLPEENVKIYRVLADGEMLLGRVIPENHIDETLRRLGQTRAKEKYSNTQLLDMVIKDNKKIMLSKGWYLKRSRVSNENRIELISSTGIPYSIVSSLSSKGAIFTERINYSTRYFVPVDSEKALDDIFLLADFDKVVDQDDNEYSLSESDTKESTQRELDRAKEIFESVGTPRGIKLVIEDEIKESHKPFAEQVESVINNDKTIAPTEAIYVCETPELLNNIGLPNLPILITQSHIKKAIKPESKEGHELDIEVVKKLPEMIKSPAIIIDSLTRDDSIVLISEILDSKERPIIVALKIDGTGIYNNIKIDTNFVTSFYGRNNFADFLERADKQEKILYINKEKSQNLFNRIRVQFPQRLNKYGFDTIIHKTLTIVNNSQKKYSLGYHAGDLGKAETLASQSGGRGTGHFGTGTYFVGNKENIKTGGYNNRPVESVNFDNYNLYKPHNHSEGILLHDGLSFINNYSGMLEDIDLYKNYAKFRKDFEEVVEEYEYNLDDNLEEAEKHKNQIYNMMSQIADEDTIQNYMSNAGGVEWRAFESFEKEYVNGTFQFQVERALNKLTAFKDMSYKLFNISEKKAMSMLESIVDDYKQYNYSNSNGVDSMSTEFMKQLGYEGIDVRHIKGLDNTDYGSVIYDLKGKDLARKKEIGTAKYSLSYPTINAYYDKNTKEIHISKDAAKNPVVLLGHELFHSLDEKSQGQLAYFFRTNSDTTSDTFKEYKAKRIQAYSKVVNGFTERDFWNEFAAENCETLFTNESYINKLIGKSRSLGQKILDFIRKMIYRLTGKTYKYSEATRAANLSLKQLARAEKLYAAALDGKSINAENITVDTASVEELEADRLGYVNELAEYDLEGNPKAELPSGEYDSTGKELTNGQSEYFKDSKVRDKDGNLLKVYHGSPKEFTIFDKDKLGKRGSFLSSRIGFYFSNDVGYAKIMTGAAKEEKNIYATYLNIQNPLKVVTTELDSEDEVSKIENTIKNGNYDGIVDELGSYVAFSPEQIKSVDNLNPSTNPDIRYSLEEDGENESAEEIERKKKRTKELNEQFEANRVQGITPERENFLKEVKKGFGRTFKYLPEHGELGTKFAEFRKEMLKMTGTPQLAANRAISNIKDITNDLSKEEHKIFEKLVYYNDLKEEIDMQVKNGETEIVLPNGISPEDVTLMLDTLEKETTPTIEQAIQKRRDIWQNIIAEYTKYNADIGYNTENKFMRKDYYHHQVIEYLLKNAKASDIPNDIYSGSRKANVKDYRGWLKQREGSEKAINTDFMFVEYGSMLEMIYDTYIAKALSNIKQRYNIKPQLERQALQMNKDTLNDIIKEESQGEFTIKNGRMIPNSETYKEQQQFNKRIMYGFTTLISLAKQNNLYDFDGQFVNVVNSLRNGRLDNSMMYQLIGQLAALNNIEYKGNPKLEEAVIGARTILKYKNLKKKWLEDKLGENFMTWEKLVDDNHKIFQPRKGRFYYNKEVVEADTFDNLVGVIANQMASKEFKNSPDAFNEYKKTVKLIGAAFEEWVVPNEVLATMNDFAKPKEPTKFALDTKYLLDTWKMWSTSGNPARTIKFGLRNMDGDYDAVLAGDPGITKYVPRAVKEVYNAMRHKQYTADMNDWVELGGYNSLIYANEMDKDMQEKLFKQLVGKDEKALMSILKSPVKLAHSYLNGVEAAHNFRESILRYSAYLYYKNKIDKNGGQVKDYVASNKYIVNGLESTKDKAYQLSKDLLGAYDEVSVAGKWLRTYLVPFYSFTETNFKRYTRLLINLKNYHGSVPEKVLLALRRALSSAMLWACILAWNKYVKGESDKKLPNYVREVPHLTLGSNGDEVYCFTRLGSLAELTEWIGFDDLKFTKDDFLAPVNKAFNMIRPGIKSSFEVATGYSLYPDVTKPYKAKDRMELFATTLGMNDIYKFIRKRPTKNSTVKDIAINAVTYKYDYKDSAYNDIMSIKYKFQGKDEIQINNNSPKSNALYYMKKSMKYGDKDKAIMYMKQYFDKGGTANGFARSVSTLNPMYGFTSKATMEKGEQFVSSLSEEDKIRLQIATQYYEKDLKIPDNVLQLVKKAKTNEQAMNVLEKYIEKS